MGVYRLLWVNLRKQLTDDAAGGESKYSSEKEVLHKVLEKMADMEFGVLTQIAGGSGHD